MASPLNQSGQESQPRGHWIDVLTRNRRRTAIVLFVLCALLALIPLWMGIKYKWEYLSVCLWGGILALLALAAGLWNLFQEEPAPGGMGARDQTRLMVLTVGGMAGLATALLGAVLAYQWWDFFSGGLEAWRKEWWRVWLCLVAIIGGLAVMFASFQLARSKERQNATLRRLLYGYNTVFSVLLLLFILGILNVMAYVRLWPFTYLGKTYDWTESSIYTLTPGSRELLEHLNKPVKVYVFLPMGDFRAYQEVENLMNNCRAVTGKFDVEYLSPDQDFDRIIKLQSDFGMLSREREGLLVVYGTGAQAEHEFIPYNDLITTPDRFAMGEDRRFQFKGEDALMKKISFLEEGKTKAVIYFTQGNGELDLNSSDPSGATPGLGLLKERLQKGNYEIKDLKFGPRADKVPEDASLVVIARPAAALPDYAVKALRDYMNPPGDNPKKGKLVVLLNAIATPEGAMLQTGLEPLLMEYNVQPGDGRILDLDGAKPGSVVVTADFDSRNPIAAAFRPSGSRVIPGFLFDDVRPIRPLPGTPPASHYVAEAVLEAWMQYGPWVEKDLRADPVQLVNSLRKAGRQEWEKKLSQQPLPVAVAVSEPVASAPPGDPHDFMRPREQRPRLAVFGDSTWVSNREMARSQARLNYQLFANTLSWLREKSAGPTFADPKDRSVFSLSPSPGLAARLDLLPALIMFVGIIGLGAGIWVVRRR
jgi:hypothetical protein